MRLTIESGYRAGIIGRAVEMHARHYARSVGFGRFFECKVAAEFSHFAERLDNPRNQLWSAVDGEIVVGTIAIDGEDMGPGVAHLRWFIVEDGVRGGGIGQRLLAEAVEFCDKLCYCETHLWTFPGLDPARRLDERNGSSIVEERPGNRRGNEVIEQRFVRKI